MVSCFIGGPGKNSERPVYVYRWEEEINQGPREGLGGPEWNLDAQKRDLEDQWSGGVWKALTVSWRALRRNWRTKEGIWKPPGGVLKAEGAGMGPALKI